MPCLVRVVYSVAFPSLFSPTVKSTLQSLSAVYKGQGRLETAKELDKLTEVKVLNKSQQDRIAEILSGTSEASDSPSPSPTPSTKTQVRTYQYGTLLTESVMANTQK